MPATTAKPPTEPKLPSVADHPRAGAQVAKAKSWAGLAGFGLTAFLSHRAGVPLPSTLVRAVVGGVAGYMIAWACAVAVWRHLVIAELRAVRAVHAARAAELKLSRTEPMNPKE